MAEQLPDAPSSKIRVVLADDHPIVREGLRSLVNAQADMRVVGEAGDGEAAVRVTRELRPNVLVMDLSMPLLGGAEVAVQLRESCPDVRVLALTFHEEHSYVTQLLRAGASGYALKRSASAQLVSAVRAVAAGGIYIDPAVAGTVAEAYITAEQRANGQENRATNRLSEREYAVLVRVAKGFSNKEIAAALDLSVKTVETYKTRGSEKLDLRSRVDIVRYAARHGWLSPATEP